MVHFLPELITLNYCEGPYVTSGLPKSSHGLHQKNLKPESRFLSNTQFCKFSTAGGLGTVPTNMWHSSGSHLLQKHRHPPDLQGEDPHCPQWYKTKASLLLQSDTSRKQ